jgi:hypothetical protein
MSAKQRQIAREHPSVGHSKLFPEVRAALRRVYLHEFLPLLLQVRVRARGLEFLLALGQPRDMLLARKAAPRQAAVRFQKSFLSRPR